MCPFKSTILRRIRHLKKLNFYFIVIIFYHVIQVEMVPYVPISPCKVHNMLLQPNFGISVRTGKIVDIVQAPPLFTQTVQAGLCLESNSNPSDVYETGTSTTPPYICRQRYTSIELFSKLSDENIRSGRSILNVLTEGLLSRGIKKDFVLIEAGCDFLLEHSKFSMSRNHPKHYHDGVSSFKETEMSVKKPFKSPSYIEVIQPDNDSDGRERNFKAWSMMRRHFFRHSLHLNLNLTSKNVIKKGSDELESTELGSVWNLLHPTATSDQSLTENLKESEEMSPQLEDDNGNGILEIELKPEDIGLPVLFLVPSLDPVLHIISSLKEN